MFRLRSSTRRFLAVSLVLFSLLTAIMTYPQVLHLRDGVHDDGDPLLVTWVLAWVAHQLPRAPAHLFDANIFYPERNTLAFSETLIVPGIVVAPLHWLGVGPILVYNLVFLSGFALSGVGVALLVRRLTGNTRRRDRSPGSSSRFRRIASITTRTCSCSRRSSFRWRSGPFTACSTPAGCATACCSACSSPARCCRACTTASSSSRTWPSSAARC